METNILIVESPAKSKTIQKYLGKDFKVISSYGHVRALPSADGAVKPDENFALTYTLIEKAAKQMNEIEKAAAKCKVLYLATDPDREGEAISWHIIEILKEKGLISTKTEIKRVAFYEITKKAVLDAIKNPTTLNHNLIEAQRTRQALDWLVGFTLSPVLWNKIPGGRGGKNRSALSAGRVQSVALRLMCEREAEIEKFVTEEYWTVIGECMAKKQPFEAMLHTFESEKLEKFSIKNAKQASDIVEKLENLKYTVKNIEKKAVKRKPHAPFTTSTMLQEASRKLGFSAKKTAQIAQKLYEGMDIGGETQGLITYMRTDSVFISAQAAADARAFITDEYGSKFLSPSLRVYKNKAKNAQEAHEAIRPTNPKYTPAYLAKHLDKDQFRLYDLIWKRLLASQMSDAEFEATSVDIADPKDIAMFRASGSVLIFEGFLKVYKGGQTHADSDEDAILPPLAVGESIDIKKIIPKQHFTQPPPRYSDASLVKKMEELGIGRPSTYPTVIAILQDRGYMTLEKKRFVTAMLGKIVGTFLIQYFPKYVDYSFTAHLEDELDDISNGKRNLLGVLKEFWSPFKSQADTVMDKPRQEVFAYIESVVLSSVFKDEEQKKCPKCKDGVLGLKYGKFGIFIGCSNYPSCNHTQQLQLQSGEESNEENQARQSEFPKVLGYHPANGIEISLRVGPYGHYVQLATDPVKRASVSKNVNLADVTLEYALGILSLPRIVGHHPETGLPITASRGKFSPYVLYNEKFYSIKGQDPINISLEAALAVINKPVSQKSKPAFRKKK